MPINTSEPKKIPYSIEKKKFCELLYPFPAATILKRINCIIYARRKDFEENKVKTEEQIKRAKFVEQPEYKEYFKCYGLPEGIEF